MPLPNFRLEKDERLARCRLAYLRFSASALAGRNGIDLAMHGVESEI
jgi:hypothetical protein